MTLQFQDGIILANGTRGKIIPTADEIYSTVFEGHTSIQGEASAAADFHALGLAYSDIPASPAVVFSVIVAGSGDPEISCVLSGRAHQITAPVALDYIVVDRTWYPLPRGTREEFEKLLADAGVLDPKSITLGQYLEIQKLAANFAIDDRAAEQLAAGVLSAKIPPQLVSGLAATPYQYQQIGLQWLSFMARQGVGSILADEMGLGKTLQVIAVLLTETQHHRKPNLVLCPSTLLENWRREINRFAPSLSIRVHAGPKRTGSADELTAADVTVSSYETMAGDISIFRRVSWNVVALDEAQNIKNPDAKRTKRAKELLRRTSIAISGTPVENRLTDLWSLSDFVLPGHLGTLREFEMRFPDTEIGAKDLEPLVSAIMLRRRVRDVATDLPSRIDIPNALVMDARSADAYEEIRRDALENCPSAPELSAIIHLRMFCAHPWIVDKMRSISSPFDCSPKMERCFEILEEIFDAKSKVIIFTSFNEAAALLDREIATRFQKPVWQINGSIPVTERQAIVDVFSSVSGSAVLVLNPKAAGVGLNITAANHVIHYNLEWNPAVEDQASARSYRRGQTQPVTVHRLFYAETVEETISDRMIRKRALAENAVIGTSGEVDDFADILAALKRTPSS